MLSPYLKFGCISPSLFYHELAGIYKTRSHSEPPQSLHGQVHKMKMNCTDCSVPDSKFFWERNSFSYLSFFECLCMTSDPILPSYSCYGGSSFTCLALRHPTSIRWRSVASPVPFAMSVYWSATLLISFEALRQLSKYLICISFELTWREMPCASKFLGTKMRKNIWHLKKAVQDIHLSMQSWRSCALKVD